VLTLPMGVLSLSGTTLVMGAAICAVGAVEYVGYRKMLRAEKAAPRLLALNQLAFLGVILLYCVFQVVTFSTADARNAVISPETQTQLAALPGMQAAIYKQIDRWAPLLTYGFYSLVAFLSLCFQGGMALYYFTRQKTVESYTRGTSEWIRRLFIETGA